MALTGSRGGRSDRVHRLTRIALLIMSTAGFVLVAGLLAYYGAADVLGALAATGWGVLLVTAFHLVPMALDTLAWAALLPPGQRPAFGRLLAMRWVGESVNALVPSAQVGGDLVRAHLLTRAGLPGADAAVSVIVNLTLMVIALFAFSLAGAVALVIYLRPAGAALLLPALMLFAVAFAATFVATQRAGVFGAIVRLASRCLPARDFSTLLAGAGRLDDGLRHAWANYRRVGASTAWALAGWCAGSGEIWLAMLLLGQPVTLVEAFILESLIQAVRNGAFFVPGALGIQEGGAVLLGGLFGIAPESALALSLLKRARELLLGLPGLLAWQAWSGMRLLPARREATATASSAEGQ